MTLDELVEVIDSGRLVLDVNGEKIRYRAPKESVTPELLDAIRTNRRALIDHLNERVERKRSNCIHVNFKDWIDEPAKDGRIRTTCGKCGRFIGYRPAEP